jgi:hypothetical protein
MALGNDRPLTLFFGAPEKVVARRHPRSISPWDMLAGPTPYLFGPAFGTNPLITIFLYISMAEAF